MKPILIMALVFGIVMAGYCDESRLSASLLAVNEQNTSLQLSADDVNDVESPSLLSRWHACLSGDFPIQKSMSVNYGLSYDPNDDNDFLLLSFQWKWTYEDFWVHDAPDSLFFRLEGAGGMRVKTKERGIVSCGMFAQRYLEGWASGRFRPYIDGGVGIIYTDFQNKDQGLRVNFNPRFSLGADIKTRQGITWFVALRMFHISNGELHHDNRGINAAMVVIGRYF